MGLRKKTFLYSMALAGIMVAFVIGYFILMLPSLYVDYVMKSNLDSIAEIQRDYMGTGTYEGLNVKNPSSTFSLAVPKDGNEIYLEGKFFKVTARVRDEELQAFLDGIKAIVEEYGKLLGKTDVGEAAANESTEDSTKADSIGIEDQFARLQSLWNANLKDKLMRPDFVPKDYPLEIELESRSVPGIYQDEYSRVHSVSNDILVYENGVSDGDNSYTTYMAVGWSEDAFIVTVMPTMTPKMEEITPIVWSSLPMIIAVIFLVILISSRFFSGRIVNPVIRLADSAESAAVSGSFEDDAFDSTSGDEIGILGRNLHVLYGKLRENYEELERKNRTLEEENERQEVFLRASSHQLKTPVAAALLLVEGMMNEVGKYKDTKAYLPEVKKQLLSMRKIVEDILYLNHCADNMRIEEMELKTLAEEVAARYAVQAEDKGLSITIAGSGSVTADREMLCIIMDNLLSNAVQYTPKQQRIVIQAGNSRLCVTNYGVTIDEKLLPNVLEPFVSNDTSQKGKGLGLYVASYYCRRMDCRLEIRNIENGVEACVLFR